MKTSFYKYLFPSLLLCFTITLATSCGDDEEEPTPTPTPTPTPSYSDISMGALNAGKSSPELPVGYRIKSIVGPDDYIFGYKSDGTLSSICSSFEDGLWTLSLVPFWLHHFEDSDHDWKISCKFNEKGYVSKITDIYYEQDDDYWLKDERTTDITYNTNDQISELTQKFTYINSGHEEDGTQTITFTYIGDILKKINRYDIFYDEDGDVDVYNYSYTFSDCRYENPYFQYTPNVLDAIFQDIIDDNSLAHLGLLGKASGTLPGNIIEEEDGYHYEYTCSYSYNSYGAIKEADGHSYTYTTLSDATRSAANERVASPRDSERKIKKQINRHQRHHRRFRDRKNSLE